MQESNALHLFSCKDNMFIIEKEYMFDILLIYFSNYDSILL